MPSPAILLCSLPFPQIRANATKTGVAMDSYYMFNAPKTTAATENNCKSPADCPDDDQGRELAPWTAVSINS